MGISSGQSIPASVASSVSSTTAIVEKESYIGRTPEHELHPNPRWVVFDGSDGYRRPQIAKVSLQNLDKEPVIFRLRARERAILLFSKSYGLLKPGESTEITLVIPPSDQWPRDPNELSGRRVRFLVENLLLPLGLEEIQPNRVSTIGKKIFHTTANNAALTRLYTKVNLLLPKVPDDYAMIELHTSSKQTPTTL